MTAADKLQETIKQLPAPLQAEALNFIEFLLSKAEQHEAMDWSSLSLELAMRDIESEDEPVYTPADLKITFS